MSRVCPHTYKGKIMFVFALLACFSSEKDTSVALDTSVEDTFLDSGTEPSLEPDSSTTEDPCGWTQNQNADPLSLSGDSSCGETVYMSHCAVCHMEDGSGNDAGKRLAGRIDSFSDAEIIGIISSGKGTMPPISISAQEKADVLAFLRSAF